jgi:signal transduction histidine kinase
LSGPNSLRLGEVSARFLSPGRSLAGCLLFFRGFLYSFPELRRALRSLFWPRPSSLSRRFPLDPAGTRRVELVLATSRTFLAVTALLAVYLDPTEPSRYAPLAYVLFLIYVILSFIILAVLRGRSQMPAWFPLSVHGTDVLWAAAITLFTEGPSSPFFIFFVFVLLAAAYRWGYRETLATTAVAILLVLLQVLLITTGGFSALLAGAEIEVNRIIMRATYLLLMGFLLGYLAEQQKQFRAESAAVARLMGLAQMQAGLRASMQVVLEEILRLFGARQALLLVREKTTGRFFLWEVERVADQQPWPLRLAELDATAGNTYLFPAPASAWFARRSPPRRGNSFQLIGLDAQGRLLPATAFSLPDTFLAEHRVNSLLVAQSDFGEEWMGRLFLLELGAGSAPEGELRFLQSLIRQLNPALNNLYLLRRLRSRASAMERARVARELHDGTIQSLIAIELQVEVLRRQALAESRSDADLARLQQLLRQEVISLRELMQHLKPPAPDPKHLLEFMADAAEKFRRETGIATQFVSDLEEVSLPPRDCRELARIVQEALVNVRKHSRARNVLIRFAYENGCWKLVVDDDGRGFDFSGRLDQAELDAARKGPVVIKERVRSIGGEVAIESHPQQGSRLEITLPQRIHG